MKTKFLSTCLTSLVLSLISFSAKAQIVCILCYNQNDSISSGVNNLLQNGGFENGCITGSFCPVSQYYTCDIPNWTCAGGGYSTYCQVFDSNGAWYGGFLSRIIEGHKAAYLGNYYCNACSSGNDTSCISDSDCTVMSLPPGYPNNTPDYGGTAGVSVEQTVTGLIVGNTYVLEFWAGGEYDFGLDGKGIFGVDVGFGDTMLRCHATSDADIGTRYIIEFNAIATSQTIKFTNWGHICYSCTEVVLDNVRLYTLAELSSSVPSCVSQSSSSSFAASDTDICEKFCVDFFDSSSNNPTAWQWIFPGGSPSSSTLQNPINICYDVPGVYDVTLITTSASGNDTLTLTNYITVYATPAFPTITQVGYTLTSSPATFYQWQFNSYDIPGATNQSYTVLQTGYYTVVVSNSNGCVNSFTTYVLISGVDDVSGGANISVYPNPATDGLMIEWFNPEGIGTGGFAGKEISIDVTNTLGQKVFSSQQKTSSAHWKKEIDLHDVASGIYFIEIKSENIFLKKKIMITH